jgi:hydroxymethylpyrimidine pyrophosphatase-like HAD family hydrolase
MNSSAPAQAPVPISSTLDVIVCDIDGCLGPESHAPMAAACLAKLAEYNRRAITARREGGNQGPIVTLCSGRPQPFVEAVCRMIGNDAVPAVAEMGVWLYDPRPDAPRAFERDVTITPQHLGWVRDATAWIERELVPKGFVIQPGKSASISLWHHDTGLLMQHKHMLTQVFTDRGWGLRVSSTVAWVNCDLEHISKATGIARLTSKMGYVRDRLGGIGDTMGDMAIREGVARFGVPSNAADGLKAHADYVASKPELQGVLEILEWMLRGA